VVRQPERDDRCGPCEQGYGSRCTQERDPIHGSNVSVSRLPLEVTLLSGIQAILASANHMKDDVPEAAY
jgi:hypothetical protein